MLRRRPKRFAGFTLLEMAVTMMIFAILVALGVPSMRVWLSNSKVRSVADSLQNGLRLAQAESLRRSRQTVFYLTNSTTPQTDKTANPNGNYWSINTIPSIVGEATEFIEAGEVSAITSGVRVTGGPTAICFNSAGRLVPNNATGIAGATCLPAAAPPAPAVPMYSINVPGADRQLNVMVTLGGQVHLCDPAKSLSTEPDGCP
jgi:type IV fimbrial biogenesis protein FimT